MCGYWSPLPPGKSCTLFLCCGNSSRRALWALLPFSVGGQIRTLSAVESGHGAPDHIPKSYQLVFFPLKFQACRAVLHPHDLALDFLVAGFCDPGFTSGCVDSVSKSESGSVGSPRHVASPALVLGYQLSPSWNLVGSCRGKVWLRNVRPFFGRLVSSGHPKMELASLQILQFHRRTHKSWLWHSSEWTKASMDLWG